MGRSRVRGYLAMGHPSVEVITGGNPMLNPTVAMIETASVVWKASGMIGVRKRKP